MSMEIERKFLVRIKRGCSWDDLKNNWERMHHICQMYIAFDPEAHTSERVRGMFSYTQETGENEGICSFTRTTKKGRGIERIEIEKSISESEYLDTIETYMHSYVGRIFKIRYDIGRWEIDYFHQISDHFIAEIELDSVDEPVPTLPYFLEIVKEITEDDEWTNVNLAVHRFPKKVV